MIQSRVTFWSCCYRAKPEHIESMRPVFSLANLRPRNQGLRVRFLAATPLPKGNHPEQKLIHQIRVTGKKLSASLRLFRPALGKKRVRLWEDHLSAVTYPLGKTRNTYVIQNLLDDIDGKTEIALKKKLPSLATAQILPTKLKRAILVLKTTKNMLLKEALPLITTKELIQELKRSQKAVFKRAKEAKKNRDSSALHHWRKAIKRLLFQLEISSPATASTKKNMKILQKWGHILGEIHDCDELEKFIKKRPSSIKNRKVLREIRQRRDKKIQKL